MLTSYLATVLPHGSLQKSLDSRYTRKIGKH